MYNDLQSFLNALDDVGQLHVVQRPVSPMLEITEIADRHSKAPAAEGSRFAPRFDPLHAGYGGRALLFEQVENCDFPLCINVFGSYRRMEMALGCEGTGGFEAIAQRIGSLTKPEPPSSLGDLWRKAREFYPLLKVPPKRRRRGRCQQVIKLASRGEVDLTRLPLIKCWPLDGDPQAVGFNMTAEQAGTAGGHGRYITFAGMHTIHADDAKAEKPTSHNLGMYRAQLVDSTRLAMHWHMHHDGAAHWRSWKNAGKPMPIAICFGGESALPFGAVCPLPPGISELLMAGFLNGRGIEMVRAKTVPLWVPANSEIVIEGYVSTECGFPNFDPRDENAGILESGEAFEGPFGDHTGFYSLPDRYPMMDVTAITHRREPVFPATVVGLPPQEDYYLGKATERLMLPLLKTIIHDIEDYHLPMFGAFHNCAFIKIRKAYPLQARRVMHAVWGAGQMAWTKMIVVVDGDVDVHDERAVLRALFENCHFQRDLERVNGPLDILDHAAPRLGAGHKVGFDATRKIAGEDVNGIAVNEPPTAGIESTQKFDVRELIGTANIRDVHEPEFGAGRCLFISVNKEQAGDGARAIQAVWEHIPAERSTQADCVIVIDACFSLDDWSHVLFVMCANADPGRDAFGDGRRLAIDATTKMPDDARCGQPVRDYPPIQLMSEEIKQRVDEHAAVFGLA